MKALNFVDEEIASLKGTQKENAARAKNARPQNPTKRKRVEKA